MAKLKTIALVTALLGIISTICVIYDYVILTDTVYMYDATPPATWRWVALGVIPIILFHFSFFVMVIMLFDYLKQQKEIVKENHRMKKELEAKPVPADIQQKKEDLKEQKKEIGYPGQR